MAKASSSNSNAAAVIARLQASGISRDERLRLVTAALKHRRGLVRRIAIETLAAVRPSGFIDGLVAALSDRSWEVRVAAAERLEVELAGTGRGPVELIDRLSDSSNLVRLQAAEALGVIGERRALPRLRAALSDRDALVRRYVAESIGRLGTAKDRETLEGKVKTERSESARVGFYHGIYLLRGRPALRGLTDLLASQNYIVRSGAAAALYDADRARDDSAHAIRELRRALGKETTAAREYMERSLAHLGIVPQPSQTKAKRNRR